MEALLAEAVNTRAAAAARRDSLAALIFRAQESDGVDCEACVELAVQVLGESPAAPATVRRHALWLLAHAHPASATLVTMVTTLQAHMEPASPPRVRAVALRTVAWLEGRGAMVPSALIAASWAGLSSSAECVRIATLEAVAAVAHSTGDAAATSASASEGQEERLQELAKGVGSVADRLADGSVAVRVAAARALGRLHCVRGHLTDARWLGLVIAPTTAAANGSAALEADDASVALENAVTRKRRRREQQLVARAQQREHEAEEAKTKDTDPMTHWLIPGQSDDEKTVEEEDGEIAETVPVQSSEQEGAGALGMALDDEAWKVRQAAVQALRMLCCAQPTNTTVSLGDSDPKGLRRAKGKRKAKRQEEDDLGTSSGISWDVPLQLSRRVLVYLHDMVGDTSADVQRSAVRAIQAVLVAHQAARPPLALSDRQLAALVSPTLLDADQQQLLRQDRIALSGEAAGADSWRTGRSVSDATSQYSVGVSLATHRLLGSAVHPSGSTIHRTLRALAKAAAARDAVVTSQHPHSSILCSEASGQERRKVDIAMSEVRSILNAAAAVGKHSEHAGQIHPAGMGALLGTVAEGECTDDDQRTLIEQCVAWLAVFHAAVGSPQLQAELPPQEAAAMYATIASAEHYGGEKLLPKRQELPGCEALLRAPPGHTEIEDESSEIDDRESLILHHTAEQHGLAGAAEHAWARIRTACLRAAEAALVARETSASLEPTTDGTNTENARNTMPAVAVSDIPGPDLNAAIAKGTAVVEQSQQMVSALMLPFSRRCSPSKPASAALSQCRYTMGYANFARTLLRLIKVLAERDLTGGQQGDAAIWKKSRSAAEGGLWDAEELLQCSYELQYGFSFALEQGESAQTCASPVLHEIEMRQVRLFAHVASVILASSAADCRPALCRALRSRITGLRSTIAAVTAKKPEGGSESGSGDGDIAATITADSTGPAKAWMELLEVAQDQQGSINADSDDSVRSRKVRKDKAIELMAAVWRALMQIFSRPFSISSAFDATEETQAKLHCYRRPMMCYARLQVLLPRCSSGADAQLTSASPIVVLSTLPWQLRLQMQLWNVPTHAALALRVTLRRQGQDQPAQDGIADDNSLLVLPLAALHPPPPPQEQAAHWSAAALVPLPLAQDDTQSQDESGDAVLQMGTAGVEWDDHLAEMAACTGVPSSASGATHDNSCGNGANVIEWETSATVVLPRDVRRGLYTASVGLVRLFSSEVQTKKIATTQQQRDLRRGTVSISELCELSIAITGHVNSTIA